MCDDEMLEAQFHAQRQGSAGRILPVVGTCEGLARIHSFTTAEDIEVVGGEVDAQLLDAC